MVPSIHGNSLGIKPPAPTATSLSRGASGEGNRFDGFAANMAVPVTRTRRASIAAPPGLGSSDFLVGVEVDYQHDYRPSKHLEDMSPTAATFGLETPPSRRGSNFGLD